ncbi:MAG: STAS domain-containing protein [Phycisphaerae bacterium]
MTIELENRDGVSFVTCAGELRGADDAHWFGQMNALLDKPDARLIMDLEKMTYLNSSGLGKLVQLAARANSQGGRVILSNASPFVRGVIEATGLNRFFELADTTDQALSRIT